MLRTNTKGLELPFLYTDEMFSMNIGTDYNLKSVLKRGKIQETKLEKDDFGAGLKFYWASEDKHGREIIEDLKKFELWS